MKISFERIKYSPFGKRIMNRFKMSFIVGALLFPLMLFFCLVFFAGNCPENAYATTTTGGIHYNDLEFNASRYNSMYQNIEEVRPNSIILRACRTKQIATTKNLY